MKLVHWIFAACLVTASCDIVLNFNFGGSLRFCQLAMMFVCIAAVGHAIQNGRILWARGSTTLAVWLLTQFLFLPFSGGPALALEFALLLLFTAIGIFAVVQLYAFTDFVEPIMRVYMSSFVAIAIFGLVQFFFPLVGLPAPYIAQWIIHGKIARINGFSYEPSYFATYLLMGWVMLIELRLARARIARGAFWKWATVLVTLALFLSTSKTAWILMIAELLGRVLPGAVRALHNASRQIRAGQLKIPLPRQFAVLTAIGVLLVIIAGARQLGKYIDPTIFIAGTGLANTPAHSYNDRVNYAARTWQAFEEHPFIGRSLGGVAIYIASRDGIQVRDIGTLRQFEGFPVILEILVASGLIGFIPFAMFVYSTTFGAFRLATLHWPAERARWLRALARGMVFEWLTILFLDQNLLRVYVWFHITMVMLVAYNLEFAPSHAAESAPAFEPNGRFPSGKPFGESVLASGGATATL